jgi:uncharacterized protein YigE (DUF2233 family)
MFARSFLWPVVLSLATPSLVPLACKSRAPTSTTRREPTTAPTAVTPVATPGATSAIPHATREDSEAGESFSTERWSVALEAADIEIHDLHMTRDLADALRVDGALLAVNGGFFGVGGEPLGLAVTRGTTLSRIAPQLSGGVLVVEDGGANLAESESFDAGSHPSFAIQCRPRLVVRGVANVKRDDGQRAERTALCARDGGRTVDAVIARSPEGGPSLFALARYLARTGCEDALNLDGGPSTGAAWREGTSVHVELPRGAIRHAVVFVRRGRGAAAPSRDE